MSRLVYSCAPIALVALAMACEGNPEVHHGSGLLEFGTTVGDPAGGVARTTRLALYTEAPFDCCCDVVTVSP